MSQCKIIVLIKQYLDSLETRTFPLAKRCE